MTFEEIKVAVAAQNEDALLANGFENALIGVSMRFGQNPIALYCYDTCIEILMKRDGMTQDEAEEYFEFNVIGAGMGENTPAFAMIFKKEESKKGKGSK